MHTSSVYHFNNDDFSDDLTIYINGNGHPQSAALYFFNMLESSGRCYAMRFIRGNENAYISYSEPTWQIEGKYTIDVNNKSITVNFRKHGQPWSMLFSGSLKDFINKNINPTHSPTFYPVISYETHINTVTLLTIKQCKIEALRMSKQAALYYDNKETEKGDEFLKLSETLLQLRLDVLKSFKSPNNK